MPLFGALASMLAICTYRYVKVWTPLQRFYFATYVRSALRSAAGSAKNGQYELLAVTTKNGSHWASDGEVTEGSAESGGTTVSLTQEALKNGGLHLMLVAVQFDDGHLHNFLRQAIYEDQTLAILLRPSLWSGLVVLFLWPAFTLFKEAVGAHGRSRGRRLDAPRLASPQVLTRKNPFHGGHPDPTYGNPSVATPTNHGVFRQATPTRVKPHEPRTAVRTAVSVDDDAHRKVQQNEIKQEPEHKSKSKPVRKERYFQ